MIWTIVIIAAALAVAGGVWLLLRTARARPSGQHRGPGRARRRDPHDPIRQDNEEPPELDQP